MTCDRLGNGFELLSDSVVIGYAKIPTSSARENFPKNISAREEDFGLNITEN